ncbi:LytR family transcriptional regulator [Streptomyces sp. RKND-216]|nr:LytR family transcriptional regulator [Streptomyces sp. RKND-216]
MRWIAIGLAVLVLVTSGGGYLYYQHLNGNLRTGERSASDSGLTAPGPNAQGDTPLNILVLGSDSRNSDANLELGGSRDSVGQKPLADVQMLLHISADRSDASMISIPRDTRVDIPECSDADTGKTYPETNGLINTTLGRGGPGCTLATWEKLTGVYIHHWVTVDFAGVVAMADAVGGVEVCVEHNVWDRPLPGAGGGSGLKLTAGTHEIKGETALQWLRTRHAFHSDIGRAKAQHMYLNSMLRKLKSQNVFTNTGRLLDLAESATKALTVSNEIGSVKDLYNVGVQFQNVPTDRVTMATMPTVQDPSNPNHLLPGEDASHLWAMLRDDVPLDGNGEKADTEGDDGKAPGAGASQGPEAQTASAIPVRVLNGTGSDGEPAVGGRAGSVTQQLQAAGFGQAITVATPQPQADTTLTYPESGGEQSRADALSVAKELRIPEDAVKASSQVQSVTLVVGDDWREGTSYEAPGAGSVPDSADPLNASDDSGTCMPVYEPYRW